MRAKIDEALLLSRALMRELEKDKFQLHPGAYAAYRALIAFYEEQKEEDDVKETC